MKYRSNNIFQSFYFIKKDIKIQKANSQPAEKTSVRVKYAPGGQSNIIFGNDQTNYDDFKKNSGAGLYRK